MKSEKTQETYLLPDPDHRDIQLSCHSAKKQLERICVPKQEEAVNHRVNTEMLKAFKSHKEACERDGTRSFPPSLLEHKG
ncbi:hypothetical protein DPX16_17607 [Anabarilius grahami]|uniref:Uncharacterized protein n=1 Tax=Anabarilius grahami TaxID=495550 RepID=A0A3N0XZH7_ANAGA|nr:hypothetical protein DPX16_17607 [Anabarilius grahami]